MRKQDTFQSFLTELFRDNDIRELLYLTERGQVPEPTLLLSALGTALDTASGYLGEKDREKIKEWTRRKEKIEYIMDDRNSELNISNIQLHPLR